MPDPGVSNSVYGAGSTDVPLLELQSVTMSFGGFTAINKLSNSFYENVVKDNPNVGEVNLEFGFSLTGAGKLYVVEAGVEASFKVSITFKH